MRDRIPIVVGGNSDAALRRVTTWGDGWYGFNLDDLATVRDRVAKLEKLCVESGRDRGQLRLSVALREPSVDDIGALAEAGVDELVLVASPPDRPEAAGRWVSALAQKWIVP